MDVSDVILKLGEHCHSPADWNNKVADDVLCVECVQMENYSNDGRLHLLPGTQVEFHTELEP